MHSSSVAGVACRAPTLARCLVAICLTVLPCAAGPPVAFRTGGGDAWTFEKRIEVSVPDGLCDDVVIASNVGLVTAEPRAGTVVARIPLGPGDNTIAAERRKAGRTVRPIAHQRWHVRLNDVPSARPSVYVTGGRLELDGHDSTSAPSTTAPIVTYAWRGSQQNPAPLAGLPTEGRRVALPVPSRDGEYRVTLRVMDAVGRANEGMVLFRVVKGTATAVDPLQAHPDWMDDAVVYGVVPTLFGPRGLADVTDRLDELAALGINTLWLSPITPAPGRDFGYAVTDYFNLRPSFGTDADLHALITAAHSRGLHVVLDFVANHLSAQNAYFADAAAHLQGSAYFDFFTRDAMGQATHYFDWNNLENLNFDNPDVQRMVIEGCAHWVRDFDVDGFRVDAAWGPRERTPDFWPHWAAELRRIKPDLLMLAEASAHDPYYARHGFDAAYDWTDELGEWAWSGAFEDWPHAAGKLRAALTESADAEATVFRFLENNDTGARFVTRYGIERTRLAAALLLTLPGLPALYTGQDVGAEYEPYKTDVPIAWDDRYGLRAWYSRLVALRHAQPTLRSRAMHFIDVPTSDKVLAYVRPAASSRDDLIVLLNFGAEPVPIPRNLLPAATGSRHLVGLVGEQTVTLGDADPSVSLPGYGILILRPS